MLKICPACGKSAGFTETERAEDIDVRGEIISVRAVHLVCNACKTPFLTDDMTDPLEAAFVEYRSRKGLLQPAEIRAWREGLGLTQKEVSALLGWGEATIGRYEKGALQTEAHDRSLRTAMDSRTLVSLIQNHLEALPASKREALLPKLIAVEEAHHPLSQVFQEQFGQYPASVFSGWAPLNVGKVCDAILFLSRGGTLKTKLNKLMFYTDFLHCHLHGHGITGLHYAKLEFGPVPDNYSFYLAELLRENSMSRAR